MKRIYLLSVLFLGFALNSFAQADIALTHNVVNGQKFLAGGSKADTFQYSFKNLGPNALTVNDTIIIRTPVGNSIALSLPVASATWPGGLPKDSTAYWTRIVTISAGSNPSSQNTNFNWCDSIYVRSSGAVVSDPNLANNKICKTVTVTTWATSVNDLNKVENVAVYPNPAQNNFNVNFNSGNQEVTVTVRNVIGKVVYQQTVKGQNSHMVDASSFANGMYIVEVAAGESKAVTKVNIAK